MNLQRDNFLAYAALPNHQNGNLSWSDLGNKPLHWLHFRAKCG